MFIFVFCFGLFLTRYFLWLILRELLTWVVGQISPAGFKKANLVSMRRATTENDKNVSTNFIAAMFENDIESGEVSGERIWRNSGYFGSTKPYYSMEKVNFLENTLFYVNQSYLSVTKKKIFYSEYFVIGQVVEASNPPQDVFFYTLKETEVKMVRPCYNPETGEF